MKLTATDKKGVTRTVKQIFIHNGEIVAVEVIPLPTDSAPYTFDSLAGLDESKMPLTLELK